MKKFLALLFLTSCKVLTQPPTPEPPGFVEIPSVSPPSDAGTGDRDGRGTTLGEACANLRTLGCREGQPLGPSQTCYEHLLGMSSTVEIPGECVRTATSIAAVRACGNGNTLRFRCL